MKHPVETFCETVGMKPLPVERFGAWPSTLRPLRALGDRLGATIWLKDDGSASAIYGGNKPRKLELLLGEARARRRAAIVTIGAIGSNQILATSIYARQVGLPLHAIVHGPPNGLRISKLAIEKTLRSSALGAQLVPARFDEVDAVIGRVLAGLGNGAYLVPSGGASPLGNLGFVAAACELKAQIAAAAMPEPDDIVVPLGSGGTAAGLAVGCALAGLRCRILGVRVAGHDVVNPTVVDRQISALASRLRAGGVTGFAAGSAATVTFIDDQVGAGYGEPTEAAEEAIALLSEVENVSVDQTHSGKAMAALIAHCKREPGRNVLFWQTTNTVPLPEIDVQAARASLDPSLRTLLWPADT